MKIIRDLKISGADVRPIGVNMILDLSGPGRGILTVESDSELSGTVEFGLGLNGEYGRWFTGYVESCRQIDKKQQRLYVRETAAVLEKRLAMSCRNTDANRILLELAAKTGLGFSIVGLLWAERPISHFVNVGTGFDIIDSLGEITGAALLGDFGWQCLPSGTVRIGLREEQPTLVLSEKLFTSVSASSATAPVIPALRPGRTIRIGNNSPVRITTISLAGDMMRFELEDV